MRFSANVASLGLGLLASTACVAAANAEPATPQIDEDAFVKGAYIVEFNDNQDPTGLYDELRSDGISVVPRLDLKYRLFNGASFRVEDDNEPDVTAGKIAEKVSVKGVWPVRKIQMPKLNPSSIGRNGTATGDALLRSIKYRRDEAAKDTYSTHVMTQVDELREAGFTGKGIKVAIVDTGVDYRHPALGGGFGEGFPVGYGWDLTGDDYGERSEAPTPDADPIDTCQGHGTHVAGIIMAQENELGFTGAAPDVTLGAYKVSGCPGYTTSEILVSAFYKAYEDGSDVISCSAGDDSGWTADAAAVAVSRIAEAGVPVVVAASNSGNLGVWAVASPASGKAVAAIGSADNTILPNLMTRGSFKNETAEFPFGWQASTPVVTTNVTLRLWIGGVNNTACEPLAEDIDLTDTVPLLNMDGCQSDTQAQNVLDRGAKHILFFPENESMYPPYVYVDGILGIGMVVPRQAREWIANPENITVSFGPPSTSGLFAESLSNGVAAGYTSPFSSYGPSYELNIKPQFIAPGGGILSTWTWDQGQYMVNPGTSMSTPFVAAVYALVGQVRGIFDQETLKSVISATAQPKGWVDGTTARDDILAPVAQQGAGLVQAWDAAHATTILSSSGISFNDTDNFNGEHTFSVKNTASEEVTYKLGHAKSITVYTFTPGEVQLNVARAPPPTSEASAEITFAADSLTVPAGGSADVSFTAVPPSGLNATLLPVYSGYITLEGSNGETLSVPYLGVGGSMHDVPVLVPGIGLNGVYLSSTENHFLIPVNANRTFTIPRPGTTGTAIYPKMVVTPTLGTTQLHVELVAIGSAGNSTLKVVDHLGYPTLGPVPDSPIIHAHRFGYTWNFGGFLADRTIVPEGTYKFIARGLKHFGDETKDEDWDVVETVPFNLKYLA